MTADATTNAAIRGDHSFFGHPKGIGFLAGTEVWERFSYQGMRALLMLYMTKYLLLDDRPDQVAGLRAFRGFLEGIFGRMSDLAFASQVFSLYSTGILMTPLLGAIIGDRFLGRTRSITIGAMTMAAGHLTMAVEAALLPALGLLIVGAGLMLGNLPALIGEHYGLHDDRRTRGFAIYLMAVNVGSMASPLIVGTLGEKVGWHYGFGAAGIGMIIGTIVYLVGRPYYPQGALARRGTNPRLTRAEWKVVATILIMQLLRVTYGIAIVLPYGLMLVWADTAVDRTIFGWEMPVTWILVADGILTILGIGLANRIWKRREEQGRPLNDGIKLAIGCAIIALSFVMVAALATLPKVPLLGWLAFYVIMAGSIAWADPPLSALTSRYAPKPVNATMMAILRFYSSLAFLIVGYLTLFYDAMGPAAFFLLMAGFPAVGALLFLVLNKPLIAVLESATPSPDPALEPMIHDAEPLGVS
jgi:POT family proton-dependent oligopeptide transporter